MASLAWFKFYGSDWRGDVNLKSCSLSARGLWIEMVCIMESAEKRGFLMIADEAASNADIATLVGAPIDQVDAAIIELEKKKVFSRNSKGIIYSRRIVRTEKKAKTAQKNGKKGGNPRLKQENLSNCSEREIPPSVNLNPNPQLKAGVKPHGSKPDTRSQSKDISSIVLTTETLPEKERPTSTIVVLRNDVDEAVEVYNEKANQHGWSLVKKITDTRRSKLKKRLRDVDGLTGWRGAIDKAGQSDFLTGVIPNDRNWRPDFDFFLQESSFVNLLEGRYDNKLAANPPRFATGYQG